MVRYLIPTFFFSLVALISFSMWAFSGHVGVNSTTSLYLVCAGIFFILGGLSLIPYSGNKGKPVWKLLWVFPLSFLLFALFWCIGWFTFRSHFGEIMGSAVGIVAMTAVIKRALSFDRSVIEAAAVVFLFFTMGYYLGEFAYKEWGGTVGKLGWGAGFGIGLGAGLSYLVQLATPPRR